MVKLLSKWWDDPRRVHGFRDHFDHYVTADLWTTVATNSGTITVGDAAGGIVTIAASDATIVDNDETYMKQTAETFKLADDKPLHFLAIVKFTEANTDDANIIVGTMEGVAANALIDDGGGPATALDSLCFYKLDGGTTWQTCVEVNGTQSLAAADPAVTAGAAYQALEIDWLPTSSTTGKATFKINDVVVRSVDFTYTSASEMQAVFGVKGGADDKAESLLVDYCECFQRM